MSTIYQKNGQSLYDSNGQTFDAKTGAAVSGTASSSPDPFAPVTSSAATKVSPVTSLSTDQGVSTLNTLKDTEKRLSPAPVVAPTKTDTTSTSDATAPKQPSTKVTLINPNTEQTVSFEDSTINKDQIQSYLKGGYQLAEAAGSVPSWLTPDGVDSSSQTTALDTAKADLDTAKAKLLAFDTSNDPALTSLLSSITSQWDTRISEMQQINKSRVGNINTTGIRLGSQYTGGAGGVFGGIVSEEERQGVDRISTLQSQKQQALAEAKQAYDTQQWTRYGKLVDLAQETYNKQLDAVKELNKAAADQAAKLQEQQTNAKNTNAIATLMKSGINDPKDILTSLTSLGYKIDAKTLKDSMDALTVENPDVKVLADIAKTAKQNGAPQDVMDAIFAAQNPADAYKASGDYLENGPGIIGEYQYYKRESLKAGQNPVGFNEYKTMDENRKAKTAAAINAAGLTAALTNTALKLSDDYEQRSKDFYSQRDAYNRIVASASDPSPAGDLALIFNYMKVLDPGSTVREGEFANAENAGSAWQKIGAQYNKVVSGQRLTESQRSDFVKRAGTLFNSAKTQQDVVAGEFKSRAKKYGVPEDLVVRETASTGETLTQTETGAENSIKSFIASNPMRAVEVDGRIKTMEKSLGHPITSVEFLQAFPEYAK